MNDSNVEELLSSNIAIFVAATTGQGDDPDNMNMFFKTLWSLRKNRQLLEHLKFGVIGLGDSSYQKFNYSAKRLNNLLSYLGGNPILKIGLADDQHDLGPDFVIDTWLKDLWLKLLEDFPLPPDIQPLSSNILPPSKYKVNFSSVKNDDESEKKINFSNDGCKAFDITNPYFSTVIKNDRVTAEDHFQDVRLIEFDISDIDVRYKPGDVLMVQPTNLDEHVDEFLSVLGLDPDQVFSLELNDDNSSLPYNYMIQSPCTVRGCLKNYFDFMSVPKRYFFELLSFFTTDEQEKEKFLEFASSEGQQDLYDYCNRPKRSIMEVLADFIHTKHNIPFQYLFDIIPPIKPRAYSIASSSLAIPGKAQILAAVVNYRTILKRPRLGLCTNWLSKQDIGTRVPVWIKEGTLKFPELESSVDSNVIMIGPGTGCAPFRAFIQECIASESSIKLTLFFGCRNKSKDFFFGKEWNKLHSEGKLKLFVAFSRDQEDKIYVQHIMRENADELWEVISEDNTQIYFAGNAKRVPIDIHEALTFICEKGLDDNKEFAEQYMKRNLEKRYQTETWA